MNSNINSSGLYDINAYMFIETTTNLNNLSSNSYLNVSNLQFTSTTIFYNLNSLSTNSTLSIYNSNAISTTIFDI